MLIIDLSSPDLSSPDLPEGTSYSIVYRSSFQSSTLIGRAVTRSQTSLGGFRLGFRAGYDVFRMYAVLISTNQIRALKITPGYRYR